DVRYYGQWMRDEAEKRIGHLYPKIEITAEMAKERPDLKKYVGQKLTVIAWLWARTVKSPNPAFASVDVPLASTFMLSTKAGKEAYVEPVIEGGGYRFTVKVGKPQDAEGAKNGTKLSHGANFRCLMSDTPIASDHIYSEANAGRMGACLMAIVAEGDRGRVYLAPTKEMEAIALTAQPEWKPDVAMPENPRWFSPPLYGLKTYGDLFTPRQLVALTTFSDLVQEARERVKRDYLVSTSDSPSPFMERGLGGEVNVTGHAPVSPEKLNLARQMRKLPTTAEAQAWEMLRDRRCLGLKFRRQQVILGLIVDFYCAEKRLALELDGEIHDQQWEYDQARDALLAQGGIRVVRIRNEELSLERLEGILTSPPGPLSMNGEGENDLPLAQGGAGATAYADAVGVYLGMAVSKLADAQSSLCRWKTTMDQSIATFGRQALPMVWDYSEANAFGEMAGDPLVSLKNMMRVVDQLPATLEGHVFQADAQSQSRSAGSVVSTDPPYYDNIGYADLSDFFYVWLRRSLKPVFPDLFATLAVPKAEELVATPYRHGSKEKAETFFLVGMTQAMHRLAEQAHPAFPVTIYYAFKQAESDGGDGTTNTGWDTFLAAVIEAGFAISGTWPMRTELSNRMIGSGTNALASSIVLVCRQRSSTAPTATRREFVAALKAELPQALAHLQAGNIAPVDLAQAAIGPGMAVYTRYAKVLDAEGKPLSVRAALALINQTLDEALAEQEGDFDADTRWALTWFEQCGFAEGDFGVANTLAQAKNTGMDGLVEAGIIVSGKGKVRLLQPAELPADWDPSTDSRLTVWEMVHQLIRVLEAGGESAAAALVARLGSQAETARELCYRLYTLCERKKRATEAMAYNALVQSWPEITRLARETDKASPAQAELL
ncbi:MAG: DUF559 domain-containing protein, partial [Candidatus Competibacter phosphatis]